MFNYSLHPRQPMRIRRAVPKDFPEIEAFDRFAGDRKAEIRRKEVWVAVLRNHTVGYITFNRSFYQKPFIQYLNVREDCRDQGVGQALIKFIEARCAGEKLFTSTESNNLAMLRILEKRRFTVVGIIEQLQEVAEIVYCKDIPASN